MFRPCEIDMRPILPAPPESAGSDRHGDKIGLDQATSIVQRKLFPGLRVVAQRKLYGGSINRVIEWRTDGEPASIVAKLNNSRNVAVFERERASLQIYRDHTCLPVPRVWTVLAREPEFDGAGLLMEKIPGVPLSDARITPRGRQHLQRQLARHVSDLHANHRGDFGSALENAGVPRWIDSFRPVIENEFSRVREVFSSSCRTFIDSLLRRLGDWLPEGATPTLVHGDLWGNNILVDDRHPDRPEVLAFIDGVASYCDPEYELAYLRMFGTADDTFFEAYRVQHPLRPGFGRRCRVYWLNTMMMHVRVFGERYAPACEDLVSQLRQMAR